MDTNKNKLFQKMKKLAFSFLPLFVCTAVFAADLPSSQSTPYFQIKKAVLLDESGNVIDRIVINGPSKPPSGFVRSIVQISPITQQAGAIILSNVPTFSWSFGCSPTTAAMIAGYYDRIGYSNIYTGPTNGGIMPLDNSSWPSWTDGNGDIFDQCPLSATHQGLDGRTSKGHVDDYWVQYDSTAADPFYNHWTEHTYSDCTGDYMKTSQTSKYGNPDGATTFYINPTGSTNIKDGAYGFKLFLESRGYTVSTYFTQYIYGYGGNTEGFTFAQYKQEIDAGHPVMIHLEGHTIAGVGYEDSSNTVYLHDTWDHFTHTMTWGGSYSGMQQLGVTVIHLASLQPIVSNPSPADGATVSSYNASSRVLQINIANAESCIIHYGTDSSTSASASGIISNGYCSADVAYGINLANDGTNYWYVEAANTEGTVRYPESGTLTFTASPVEPKSMPMPWLQLLL